VRILSWIGIRVARRRAAWTYPYKRIRPRTRGIRTRWSAPVRWRAAAVGPPARAARRHCAPGSRSVRTRWAA